MHIVLALSEPSTNKAPAIVKKKKKKFATAALGNILGGYWVGAPLDKALFKTATYLYTSQVLSVNTAIELMYWNESIHL